MNSELLFSMALGLQEFWQIKAVEFELTRKSGFKELHLHIGFKPGYQSPDKDGIPCPVHDTVALIWQHINFLNIHEPMAALKSDGATTNGAGAARESCPSRAGGSKPREDGELMKEKHNVHKLTRNEEIALNQLRDELLARYPVSDFRLYGSKARGEGRYDSEIAVMIELPYNDRTMVAEIDDIVYRINIEHDVLISVLVFGKDELEQGPMSESPIYKAIQREGVPL